MHNLTKMYTVSKDAQFQNESEKSTSYHIQHSHHHKTLESDINDKGELDGPYTEFENFDFEHDQSFQIGWSTLSNVIDPNKIGVEYLKAKVFYFSKYHKPINLETYLTWKKANSNESNGITQAGIKDKRDPKEYQKPVVENDKHIDNSPDTDISDVSPVLQSKDVDAGKGPRDHAVEHLGNIDNTSTSSSNCGCDGISELLYATSLDTDLKADGFKMDKVSGGNDENEAQCSVESGKDKCEGAQSENCTKEDEGSNLSLLEIASYIQNGLPIPGLISLEVLPTNENPTPSSLQRKLKPWEMPDMESVDS